ncbi:winged helix-turn-helix transcriptional regulator [Arcanobacterium haemolyticum]|nr:winged helix-turn-helix transcriptional regulator [Arcanobacterium haemolyticum]
MGEILFEFDVPIFKEKHVTAGISDVPEKIQSLTTNAPIIWLVLDGGIKTARDIAEETGLTRRQVNYALDQLVEGGQVVVDGGQGSRNTVYRRTT